MPNDDQLIDPDGGAGGNADSQGPSNGAPGFDPFADAGQSAAPPPPVPKQPATGGAANGAPGFDPFADADQAPTTPVDPGPAASTGGGAAAAVADDSAPERRDDLWPCPHCGTKNKPDRNVCRACGKSPDEAVDIPLTKKPWFIPAVVGVVLVLVWMLWSSGQPTFELVAPGPKAVDSAARVGGDPGRQFEAVEGKGFHPVAQIAVSGRVLKLETRGNAVPVRSVYLALADDGSQLAADDVWASLSVKDDRSRVLTLAMDGSNNPDGFGFAALHVVDPDGELDDLQTGDWLSITGVHGEVDGFNIGYELRRREYIVAMKAFRIEQP